MKRTIEELKYLMAFYHIQRIPIYYKNEFLGYVTNELSYDTSNALRYFTNKSDAIETACSQIDRFIEDSKKLLSKEKIDVEVIEVVYEDERNNTWNGTYDELFEKFEKANNRLRYCNGHYFKFKDTTIKNLYYLWCKVISDARSFQLYYGNGTVD